MHKREDGFVAVHIYGKDVILVAPTGEVQLDAGGDTGHNTFRAPFGHTSCSHTCE